MKWRLECQTCQRAKCYGYGMCCACDEDECKYKPYVNTVSIISTPLPPNDKQFVGALGRNGEFYRFTKRG